MEQGVEECQELCSELAPSGPHEETDRTSSSRTPLALRSGQFNAGIYPPDSVPSVGQERQQRLGEHRKQLSVGGVVYEVEALSAFFGGGTAPRS